MASDLQQQLQAAIELAQAGHHEQARVLLLSVVEQDPNQELAWLWLAVASTDRDERIQYLERTLELNPANERALRAYARLTGSEYAASTAAPSLDPDAEPALPRAARPADWTETLETKRSPVVTAAIVLITVLVVAGGAFYFARELIGDSDDPLPLPTVGPADNPSAPVDGGANPGAVPLVPTRTPRPTRTPGPSPTPIWDNLPPTWTPVPSPTRLPSRTPAPTFTPLPSFTPTERVVFPSATPTDRNAESGTSGLVTSTPRFSPTPTLPELSPTPDYSTFFPTETITPTPTATEAIGPG